MTREETRSLLNLLADFYPNAKQVKGNNTRMLDAWALALEIYSFDECRQAALEYARENKFFPDIADITLRCHSHKQIIAAAEDTKCAAADITWMRDYIDYGGIEGVAADG